MTDKDPRNDPNNDPKDVGREAKALRPNTEPRNERENPLEREFEATNERDLETRERQGDLLTEPRDNAQVDRVVADEPVANRPVADEPAARQLQARDYLISAASLQRLFIWSCVAAVLLIVVILTLTSTIDRGRYTPADETQYQNTLQEASVLLEQTGSNDSGTTARIPIEEALPLVAEKGLTEVAEALNSAAATGQ